MKWRSSSLKSFWRRRHQEEEGKQIEEVRGGTPSRASGGFDCAPLPPNGASERPGEQSRSPLWKMGSADEDSNACVCVCVLQLSGKKKGSGNLRSFQI